MLKEEKVVAVGEIGIDRHVYKKTKHKEYAVDKEFIDVQKILFTEQLNLVAKYKKTLIIHNREAKKDLLEILTKYKSLVTDYRVVFHCCEPDEELLEFAKNTMCLSGLTVMLSTGQKNKGSSKLFLWRCWFLRPIRHIYLLLESFPTSRQTFLLLQNL